MWYQSLKAIAAIVLMLQLSAINVPISISQVSYGSSVLQQEVYDKIFTVKPELARFAFAKTDPTGIVFVGDVLLARNVEYLMERHGAMYPFQGFDLTNFSDSAYIVGNFEAAIPSVHQPTENGKIKFSVASEYIPALKDAGFTHLSLANNHSFDHGSDGYVNTVTKLAELGVAPFGHPKYFGRDSVTFLPVDQGTVALIGLHALESQPDSGQIQSTLAYASVNSDMQVVFVHWGTEYQDSEDVNQRKLAREWVRAGADLIIGHHPHVMQNIDLIDGVPVLYSLGNFIFDQYDSVDTEQGMVVYLELTDEVALHLIPVSSEDTLSQPNLMSEAAAHAFLSSLAMHSAPELQESILAGKITLDSSVASSPKMAMINK